MSMISSDVLYMIHQRLCEIFVSQDPFAGKVVLTVGDLCQLRPIKGKNIFERPKAKKYHPLFEVEPLWQSMTPIVLKTNFRQGDGSVYNDILNRARIGELSEDDTKMLEQRRINPSTDPQIISEAYHVYFTNAEVTDWNENKLNDLPGELEMSKAKYQPKRYKPLLTDWGTIADTGMILQHHKLLTYNLNYSKYIQFQE